MADPKGIKCPNPDCGAANNYKSGTQSSKDKGDNKWCRNKVCSICGTEFVTIEVHLSTTAIRNNHKAQSS